MWKVDLPAALALAHENWLAAGSDFDALYVPSWIN